jgi:hypothetical protein
LVACILHYLGEGISLSSALKKGLNIYQNRLLVRMKYSDILLKNSAYFQKFEKAVRAYKQLQNGCRWLSPTILITNIILHRVPNLGANGCNLYIEIIQDGKCLYSSNPEGFGDIVVPSNVFQQRTVDIPVTASLSGEATINVYHRPPRGIIVNKSCQVLSTTIHSALLSANSTENGCVRIALEDFDYCLDDSILSSQFGIDVLFHFSEQYSKSMSGILPLPALPHKRNRILRHYLEDTTGKEIYGTASAPALSEVLQVQNGELLEEEEAEIELATPLHGFHTTVKLSQMSMELANDNELDTEYCLEYQQQLHFEEEMREMELRNCHSRYSFTTPTSSPALAKNFHFTATIVSQPVRFE